MIGRWIAGVLLAVGSAASAASRYNLQEPNSALGQEIYDLHTLIMWICVVIFVGVFGMMLYAVIKHRKSVGHQAANFHENTTVEVLWTIVPFFVLIGMAWPATKALIAQKDTSGADLTIKVTGYQWKWGYDYLQDDGEGISFYSTLTTPRAQIEGKEEKGEPPPKPKAKDPVLRRLLAGQPEQPAAAADLRHRLAHQGRPQGLPGAHRRGRTPRPPQTRRGT